MPFFLFLLWYSFYANAQEDYTGYVNPFIGTGGHGHTYPGATFPFGMVQLSPDTRIDQSWDGCSGYHYSDSLIYGFSHTHLSGTGVSDFGDILLMPVSGAVTALQMEKRNFWSGYNHQQETASPGYYAVHLQNGNIDVALTTTLRTGFHKYTFNQKNKQANIILDLVHRDQVLNGLVYKVSNTRVAGFRQSEGWAKNQVVFFVIDFSQPFESCIGSGGEAFLNKEPVSGTNTRVCFRFQNNGPIYVKVSLSPVTIEGAVKNMEIENPEWDFDKIKQQARDAWQQELKKIEIKGGTHDQRIIFYTALYHCLIVPNVAMDTDSLYLGRDGQNHRASGFTNFSVFSLWDTFRAWHPLMTIINQKRTADFINTFLVQYEYGKLLPVWELASNETECMIGYHAVSVIADAAVKGITGFDYKKAFTAMKKSAESTDRFGLGAYIKKGYIGIEDEPESVSKTMEYAYDDWCISQMAKLTGNKPDELNFLMRSQYWKNLFDIQTGFVRPKRNGNWYSPFDPKEVNNHFTEANSWQYTFFVPQDIPGLIQKMNGPSDFEKKLDALFSADSQTTGREQADITGLIGQYAHGNEPSHHMAYLYNYVERPEKTQQLVYRLMTEMYHNSPDGLIGNEDCGQMSAWFVMSAMGFYPVTPGKPEFQLGIPLFEEVKVHLENGKTFMVQNKENRNPEKRVYGYIGKRRLQTLTYQAIMNGSQLDFRHDSISLPENYHQSFAASDTFITVPIIEANEVFKEKTTVTFRSDQKETTIWFSINEKNDSLYYKYSIPFEIDTTANIKAYAMDIKGRKSFLSEAKIHKMPHSDWKISLASAYISQYHGGGADGLLDGINGDLNWRKGYWQGYWGNNFEAVIDMGKTGLFDTVSAGFLQDTRAWILMPKSVSFSFSIDGSTFSDSITIDNTVTDKDYSVQRKAFKAAVGEPIRARFIKVKAVNYGKLPLWHAGFGGDAYIFIDEIEIR